MIDCNEWRTEKRHECTNMGKVKRLELWWQLYRTSFPVWDLENFRPMDFCWHECTRYFNCLRWTTKERDIGAWDHWTLNYFKYVTTAITLIWLTVITMKGGDNNGILIHSPLATRVGVHFKDNWTPTLTNMRQRVDIKNWTSAFIVTLLLATQIGRKETNARHKMALFRADPFYCIAFLASMDF